MAKRQYGVGVLGNCCTHGAGICNRFMGHADTRVLAAYEENPRRATELRQIFGAPLAGSYEEVINHPGVDFVAITCHPGDKADMVEAAAAVGKHIFLNKPLCESLESAHRIAKAVQIHNVHFVHDIPMVRFIPVYARLLEETQAGKRGSVLGYHHRFGMNFPIDFDLKASWPERLDPPEQSGGGEMTNMGCYAIDYAVSLFGLPRAVTAKWRKTWDVYQASDVENFGQIILDYGDFFAFLDVGKQQLAGERRHSNAITINFKHETIFIDTNAQVVTINHVPHDYTTFVEGATVVDSVEQLIGAIESGTGASPHITSNVETAVIATETLMAAYQSIIEERTVTLPLSSNENPLIARRH